MTPEILGNIKAHAIAEYPRECCGIVSIFKGRELYTPCVNKAETPSEHFSIAAEDYAEVEEQGEITAIVHSHPDTPARASESDKVACEASGLPWYIVAVGKDVDGPVLAGEINFIEPCGYKAPLVGRAFAHGTLDCYTLIRDFYSREMSIELMDFERHDNWWNDGHSDLYLQNFEKAGGIIVQEKDMIRGDVVFMQIRSENLTPNHAAVYLGDGLILHHLYGRLSSRDVYGGYWKEVTRLIVRYKGA